MSNLHTLIKWPGGKSREIHQIEHLIPPFERYIEPFFGGGAMYFYLQPQKAVINDISADLMDFYSLVKEQSKDFYDCLNAYCLLLESLLASCEKHYDTILEEYSRVKSGEPQGVNVDSQLSALVNTVVDALDGPALKLLVLNTEAYRAQLRANVLDKMRRTVKNERKAPFSDADRKENLMTGFMSGTYLYFRAVYNDIILGRNTGAGKAYRCANFYFIREYCYGSMFRYNKKGEFNIPYGGMSYNRKDFRAKIDAIFSSDVAHLLSGADIHCTDFERLLADVAPTEHDFMFLDPPYDTDFSDYEGKNFTQKDQERLAQALKKTKAKFILIVKNTDFIYSLYERHFPILCFDKTYTYNVRSRNERHVEHLIITNLAV